MKAELVPENGDPPIPISRDITVLGRRSYCDVVINHHSLSKRHAVLVRTEGLLVIRDLASTNGTKVKGQRVRWAALMPGDRISLGAYKFKVYLGPDNVPAPSERAGRGDRPLINKPVAGGHAAFGAAAFPSTKQSAFPTPSSSLSLPVTDDVVAVVELDEADVEPESDSQWRNAMFKEKPVDDVIELKDADLLPEEDDEEILELD